MLRQLKEMFQKADRRTVAQRRAICSQCPQVFQIQVFNVGEIVGPQCGLCGCFLNAKTLLAAEQCPAGKW